MWTLYHNPNCSKSRAAFDLLTARGIEFSTVNYLQTPPSSDALRIIYEKLDQNIDAMIRHKEEGFLIIQNDWNHWDIEQKLEFLAKNPQWLERPIVVTQNTAKIGRPDHNALLELFED